MVDTVTAEKFKTLWHLESWIHLEISMFSPTSEEVHSELTTRNNLTWTATYQEKLYATNWSCIFWNKRIASKFTELWLIGLRKFSRFRGSVTKQQIFYIWRFSGLEAQYFHFFSKLIINKWISLEVPVLIQIAIQTLSNDFRERS